MRMTRIRSNHRLRQHFLIRSIRRIRGFPLPLLIYSTGIVYPNAPIGSPAFAFS